MPGFDYRLTDGEVAAVVTFVRNSWGNQAPAVSADQVAKVRKEVGRSRRRRARTRWLTLFQSRPTT